MNYPVLETSGDVLGGMITIFTYAGALLITSILGLPFAIVSAKLFTNKIIRICSNIEIVLFSIGIIFSVFLVLFLSIYYLYKQRQSCMNLQLSPSLS